MTRSGPESARTEATGIDLELQVAADSATMPDAEAITRWVATCLEMASEPRRSLAIRVVEADEIRRLNADYRGRDNPTNVLSFPFEQIPGVETHYLGDIVICAEVVDREALDQQKAPPAHWAHMVVHGILHLCGFDHENDDQAREMEGLEVSILSSLGFSDPYLATGG